MKVIDLNVLLYAVNVDSHHHLSAKETLLSLLNKNEPIGMPWVVLLGFIRIVTNPRILPKPISVDQAIGLVDGWLAQPVVTILHPGKEHWRILKELLGEAGTAANLTTDSHLAALALENGATLVSFDTDFLRFVDSSCSTRQNADTLNTCRSPGAQRHLFISHKCGADALQGLLHILA